MQTIVQKPSGRQGNHFVHGAKAGGLTEPLYSVWQNMRRRCNDPKNKRYADYGGRGIKVCAEWNDYAQFREDMGAFYRPELLLERIDNDGDYCKANCRFATRFEQCRNKRNNLNITYNGETKPLSAWAEALGIPYGRLQRRLRVMKWPVEKAFTARRHEF